jgi:hypothetical protein
LVQELKAVVQAKAPGRTWKAAARAVSDEYPNANPEAISKKWAWTKGEKMLAGPPLRRQPRAERQQAIEAAAEMVDDRLTAKDQQRADRYREILGSELDWACADWFAFAATLVIQNGWPISIIEWPCADGSMQQVE